MFLNVLGIVIIICGLYIYSHLPQPLSLKLGIKIGYLIRLLEGG